MAAGVVALVALGVALAGGGGEKATASPETLAHISAKNREAAIAAAARMKADSEAAARETDARLSAPEPDEAAPR